MPEIDLPYGGVSDELAFDRQATGTTAGASCVQGWDELERRPAISRVPGQVAHTSAVLTTDTKVAAICDLVYDLPNVTYAALANSPTVDWNAPTPSTSGCTGIATDELGCQYVLDGNSGFVKYTADGQKVVKVALPTLERSAILRAITVDDSGRVILGVSGGGDPKKAAIFCFKPIADRKYEQLWQIPDVDTADQDAEDVGWFTESLVVDGESLYAAQNDTLGLKSRMAVYSGLGVPNPTRVKVWPTTYPTNGLSRNPVDGSIALCHEPNVARGSDPHTPETTLPLEDAKLEEIITNYSSRARCWHSSADVDGDGSNNANRLDGVVDRIIDKTGNGRNWYAGALSGDVGATLRRKGIAGRDTLFFNGTNASYIGEAGLTTEFQDRSLNKSILPCHKKHQFAYFVVLRAPMASQIRALVCRAPTFATAGYDNEQVLHVNTTYGGSGSAAAPGNVLMYEESAGASGASGRLSGSNATPLPGAFGSDGLCIITYVFDNGYDDVVGTPSRSQIRVNGRPVDRWTSLGGLATLVATTLGIDKYPAGGSVLPAGGTLLGTGTHFLGDFLEFFCLEDSYDTGFGQTSAFAQRRLIGAPTYPDAIWAALGDTELEKIEAFFAARCGFAHRLPTGNAAILDALGVGSVNDTITISGQVYTLKAAPTTTAYEVKIGASAFLTLINLHHAINGTGNPGTDYGSATPAHPSVFSPGVVENGNTAARPDLFVQVRDPRGYNTFTVAESTATVRFNWISGATSVTARNGSGRNCGIYPHTYHYFKSYGAASAVISAGGPPRLLGANVDSPYWGLTSPHGIISVWDPQTGRLKFALSTGGPATHGLPWGGVGYGVLFNSVGDLYSIGPRQAIDTNLSTIADNVDVRKFVLLAAGFVTMDGATALLNWQAAPGAQTYKYPRMAVDKWDNVFVPLYQASNATSLVVYKKIAPSTTPGSAALSTVTTLTNDPKGQCVAVDPNWPSFPNGFTDPRAERFLLGTELFSTSATDVLFCVRLLSATVARTVTRTAVRLAACGVKLFSVAKGQAPTEISASAFATAPLFIDSCTIAKGQDDPNMVAVFVDGEHILIYDPKNGVLGNLRAKYGGEIPKRPKLTARYVNRLFFGRPADWPTRIMGSVKGDIYGWDFGPQGEDPIPISAYRSDLTTTGDHADIVTGLAPIGDDVMIVGGERSVALMVGDPMMGGQFDTLWSGSGMAFGRAHCLTPDRTTWWITNEAELAALPWGAKVPSIMSRQKVSKRLADSIDFTKFRPELTWVPRSRTIRISMMPIGVGDDLRTDWIYFPDTGAFWPRPYAAVGIQPTAIAVIDQATCDVLLGSRDGWLRESDPSAPDDDGTIIDAYCDLGPLAPQGAEMEARFTRLVTVLAGAQGSARFEAHVLDLPDDTPLVPVDEGELFPGVTTPSLRFSGQNTLIRIASTSRHERFALIRATLKAKATGLARQRT